MRTGPVLAIRQGRAAAAGHGATAVAVALSAALHGALAAGVFLWPAGPVPRAVGDAVVVELVAAVPGSDTASAAAPDDGPAADAAVPLGVQSGPDDDPPPPEDTEATEPFPAAEGAAPAEPPMAAMAEPAEPPVPAFQPPLRRPTPPAAHAAAPSPAAPEAPAPSRTATFGSAVTPPADDAGPSAAAGGKGGADDGIAATAAPVGPRFVLGSAGNPLPRYPLAARRRGLEGQVVVRVFVAADGRPASVSVHSGSTHSILDDAAVAALRRWRFEPARRAGVPTAAWVDVPITFRLRD